MNTASVTLKEVDDYFKHLAHLEAEKDAISETLKSKNKEIMALEFKLTEILDSLERDEYESPFGKASFVEEFQVKQPLDEKKHLLWEWMKEKGIFERYAQVHASSLKSLFRAERIVAIENGEDPMTFALPGMEPATIFRKLKFKPKGVL